MARVQRRESAIPTPPQLKKGANSITTLGQREVFGPLAHFREAELKAAKKFKEHEFEQEKKTTRRMVSACKRAGLR